MAKFTYTDLSMGGDPDYGKSYSVEAHTSKRVVFVDDDSGNKIVYTGHDLKFQGGIIVSGEITGWNYTDSHGDAYLKINDFTIDVDKIKANTTSVFIDKASAKLVAGSDVVLGSSYGDRLYGAGGNDRLVGNKGSDYMSGDDGKDTLSGGAGYDVLNGGKGNDHMTGGGNADYFMFAKGYGKDVVTDFRVDGDQFTHDYISADYADVKHITQSGDNTVIDFGGGDTLTLNHVSADQITQSFFVLAQM